MNPATYSFGAAALAYSALAVALVRSGLARRSASLAQWTLVGAVAASAVWGWTGLAAQVGGQPAVIAASGLLDLARYAGWFTYLLLVLGAAQGVAPRRLLWGAGICLLILGATPVFTGLSGGDLGGLASYLPFVSLALPVVGLVLVEQLFRNVPQDSRWHVKPLCLGLACVFLFDTYLHSYVMLFGRFDADLLMIRPAVHALGVPLLFIALKRHADWAGELRLSRNAAFHTATLMLVGVYLLLISSIGYYMRHFGGDWGRALELAVLSSALVFLSLLVFSGALRARLRVFIGKNFFRYRYDYRTEWLRFTAMLTTGGSPQEVGVLIVRGLGEMVHSASGGLWTLDRQGAAFVPAAQWNVPRQAESEPADSALARFLAEREWIVDLDEYRSHPERYGELVLPAWLLARPEQWLVVPLIVGEQLTGFVTLTRPKAGAQVNWEMRDLLKTASRQAASFLALMLATEALLEVRKFDAFNRMSAFVVHDLKNIVAQLSLMMQNAKRLKHNPEFQQDMLDTVESSVDKMRRLMLQLREGETPMGVSSGVDLSAIVERIKAAASSRGRLLDVEVVDRAVTRGHQDRIERVLGHVVDNALDATEASGRVCLTLGRAAGQAKIVVSDTGQGMTDEFVRTRLFKPFNTTKPSGMGIGAYESFQYVRELGGTVSVDSEIGRGTIMTILLPLFDAERSAALELYGAK